MMIFLKLFLICTCKDPNFSEKKLTNFAGRKREEKIYFVEFVEFVYSKSGLATRLKELLFW